MGQRLHYQTAVNGRTWTQVLGIWVPVVTHYTVRELFTTAGEIRWRRFSAGPPWYWEGSFPAGAVGGFTCFVTDIYVSIEIFKTVEPSSSSFLFEIAQDYP